MSILIKGMEMPTRCFNCGMCEVDDEQILCRISHGSHVEYREIEEQIAIQDRPDWCPLIEGQIVHCYECKYNNHCLTQSFVEEASRVPFDRNTYFCSDGVKDDV